MIAPASIASDAVANAAATLAFGRPIAAPRSPHPPESPSDEAEGDALWDAVSVASPHPPSSHSSEVDGSVDVGSAVPEEPAGGGEPPAGADGPAGGSDREPPGKVCTEVMVDVVADPPWDITVVDVIVLTSDTV